MYRFYCEAADFSQTRITINDLHEVHHIKDVLRLNTGGKIQIFNGKSQEADVVIERINHNGITAIVKSVRHQDKGGVKIILACAPPKKGKFELIIEKCTELGVDEIIPLRTQRSQVIFTEERKASKQSRFDSVAINAAKQSKRMKVPIIHPMQNFNEVIKQLDPLGLCLIPCLSGHPLPIRDALARATQQGAVTILIGPEGDFTPDEVTLAKAHHCIPVSLGSTVLKVETAAMASVALVRFLKAD